MLELLVLLAATEARVVVAMAVSELEFELELDAVSVELPLPAIMGCQMKATCERREI